MDQKLQQAKTLREKLNVIESQDRKLPQQELENLYKAIHLEKDAYKILDLALEHNFGGLLPDKTSMGTDYNEGVLKRVSESLEDLLLVGVYARHIENSCRSDSVQPLFKQLGYVTERLIRKFRQQGVIQEALHMESDIVIDLVSRLCPKHMTYNPELFELIMKAFENYNDSSLLERLATSLYQQCTTNSNLNDHHDWLMLLSTILDQAMRGKNFSQHILLKKVGHVKLGHLISEHKNFLLFNYFDSPEKAVKIFKGLIRYNLSKETITMITEITDNLESNMRDNKSLQSYLILAEVYQQVILPLLLPQIHMSNEILDLVKFYLIGMAKSQQFFTEEYLNLACSRIKLIIDLKYTQRDQFDFLFQFMSLLRAEYYEMTFKHIQFNKLFPIVKERCLDQQIPMSISVWNPHQLEQKSQDDQFYDRETEDFVGLENLTNTCFMNSILQALYMTDHFRKFILRTIVPDSQPFCTFRRLFMLLTYQKAGFCSPYELKRLLRAPYGNSNDQQDVGEFVHHFLEDLLKFLPKEKQEILDGIFFGCHKTIIQCQNQECKPQIGQNEKFLGMVLHIDKQLDLNQMIKQIYSEESIEFTCENCKQQSNQIKKSQQIIYLPPVLVLTLQRFQYQANINQNVKILDKVPLLYTIDMREVFSQPQLDSQDSQYILYAFIVHLGKYSYSGHYSCYARSMSKPETWIALDDTQISKQILNCNQLNEQLIDEETPYLLFYKNKSGHRLTFNR